MPEVNDEGIKLRNYNRFIRDPFVIYGDFESSREPIGICEPSGDEFHK